MSEITIVGEAWAAIMADPKLEKARRKLSFHEIRLIMTHARSDLTERAARYETVISELSAKLDACGVS